MAKNIKRKQFIKLSLLTGTGLYLNSCDVGNNKSREAKLVKTDSIVKDTTTVKFL